MSTIYEPGDHPGDVLNRAACVVAFISEVLEGYPPTASLSLSARALSGLCLITQDLSESLELAAKSV